MRGTVCTRFINPREVIIYVLVTHNIADPDGFGTAEAGAEAHVEAHGFPDGVLDCPISLRSSDRRHEVCLFEADSVAAVHAFVEPLLGPPLSENSYVEIAPETVPALVGSASS